MLELPAVVGVPEITPVVVFKDNPAGRLPEARVQVVYVPLPPVAAKVVV